MRPQHIRDILIVGLYTLLSSADPIDWCTLDCVQQQKVETNTMCAYRPQTKIGNCENIRDSNTGVKRKMILHLHNQFRNALAGGEQNSWPAASNMQQMSWDYRLEDVALRWAQQCKPGHDDCRRTPEFKIVGQNYGMLANTAINPESSAETFKHWIDEMSLANPSVVDSYQSGKWGHFTQVAWAESYKVGCAQVHFTEEKDGTSWYKTVMICNYGPMGNVLTRPIYNKGDPCTQCPEGWRCIPGSPYPKLCAVPESGDVGGPALGPGTPALSREVKNDALNNHGMSRWQTATSLNHILMVFPFTVM